MSVALLFALASLAAFRITRLLTIDTLPLVAKPRDWLERKLPGDWADLAECPWCLGVHVTAAVFAVVDRYASLPLVGLQAIAAMAVVGLLAEWSEA